MGDDVEASQHTRLADYMIILSRRLAPYCGRPITAGILNGIAEFPADEAHWPGTASRLGSTVEHAGAVRH